MNKVRTLLSLLTVVIIVTPILGIVLVYRNNLQDTLIPLEITEITTNLFGSDGSGESWLQTPKLVGPIEYDPATRVITFSFNFTNSFPIGITINSLSGNVLCAMHSVPLGAADLKKPVMMSAGETKTLSVVAIWTDDALVHFQRLHPGENTIDVYLVDIAVDAGGVKIQSSEPIRIDSVPIM
jgi:hypothetical protein